MRFVHADYEIVKLRQDVRKGSTQRFLELMEVELCVRLAVEDFTDVKDEKLNLR